MHAVSLLTGLVRELPECSTARVMSHSPRLKDQFLSSVNTCVPFPVRAVKGRDGVDRYTEGSRSIKADIGEPFSSRVFPSERQTKLSNVGQHFSPRPVPPWRGPDHVTWPALGVGR